MKIIPLLVLFIILGCAQKKPVGQKASAEEAPYEVVFEATEGILHPESALYSERHQLIFVSNVATGNPLEKKRVSYLSKLAPDGTVILSKWIGGFRAPKGMALVGDHLYVSDVDEVVQVSVTRGVVVKKFPARGAKFLNDVAADAKGNVYISDMFNPVIWIIDSKGLRVWLRDERLRSPNGLYVDQDELVVALWGGPIDPQTFKAKTPGGLLRIPLEGEPGELKEDFVVSGHLDGVARDPQGNFWISDWISGDIHRLALNGKAETLMNFGNGTADISYAAGLGLLLVPQMMQNKVLGVRVR
jgi:sugar lactone lactonase YvrE